MLPACIPAIPLHCPDTVNLAVPYAANAYTSIQDMVLAYGETHIKDISNRDDCPPGAVLVRNDSALIQAINEASGEVDKYLGKRFVLPLTLCGGCPPPLLRRLTSAIARWMLFTVVKPDEVQKEYDQAIKNLTDIAEGKLTLQCPDGTPIGAPAAHGAPLYAFDCARFDCAGLQGFRFTEPNASHGCGGCGSGCKCSTCCRVES